MDRVQKCKIHNKDISFFKYNEEGQYSYECAACVIRKRQSNVNQTILIEEIINENSNNNHIIYNWPPLESDDLHHSLQDILIVDNECLIRKIESKIDEIKRQLIESIDLLRKKFLSSLFTKQQLQDVYNNMSQRQKFCQLIKDFPENDKDVSNFIKEQFNKKATNTKKLEGIITENKKTVDFCFSSLNKLDENFSQQVNKLCEYKEIIQIEELVENLNKKEVEIQKLQNQLDQQQQEIELVKSNISQENKKQAIPSTESNTLEANKSISIKSDKQNQSTYIIHGQILDQKRIINPLNISINSNVQQQQRIQQMQVSAIPNQITYLYKNKTVS